MRKLGMKTNDPRASLFPKAVIDVEHPIPLQPIDYAYLFSPIEDQGNAGTCVAFGCGSVFEAYLFKRRDIRTSVSKRAIYSIAKHLENATEMQDDGLYISDGLRALEKGYVLSAQIPYTDHIPAIFEQVDPTLINPNFEISGFEAVNPDSDSMLAALYKRGPLVIGVNYPENWMNVRDVNLPTNGLKAWAGGHCMCVMGTVIQNEQHYAIVRNSWGLGWGFNGYGIITFEKLAQIITDVYTVKA